MLSLIAERVAPTLLVTLTSLIIAVAIGTLLGVRCARRNGGIFDQIVCALSYLFDSTPSFWLGLMLILLFASNLHWLPTSGMLNMRAGYTGLAT